VVRRRVDLAAAEPGAGAAVMATGIVSVALADDRYAALSLALLAAGVAVWVALAGVAVHRALVARSRWREQARSPAALTAVAATVVLGSRFALLGHVSVGIVLLALAAALWLVLLPPVLGHWRTPTAGGSFMLVVATEALAALAALVALDRGSSWLAYSALVLLALGFAAYAFVLARFDLGELLAGGGDQWVAGGALAIATLACARVAAAIPDVVLARALGDAAVALWVVAAAWLPVLVAAELRAPRLAFDVRRWATVFPLGMYAACSFVVASVTQHAWLGTFARVWVWVAFAVWAVVAAGAVRRLAR